jgi:Undecaprenyl-phosphate glucose phosphotransferase
VLREHHQFFKSLMAIADLVFLSAAWWLAYALRFESGLIPVTKPYVFRHYLIAWFLVSVVWTAVFAFMDLYRPRRVSSRIAETLDLVRGSTTALLVFLALLFLIREIVLSRAVVILFFALSIVFLVLSHLVIREALRFLRRRGFNLRYVLILGLRPQIEKLLEKLERHRHLGMRVAGIFCLRGEFPGAEFRGVPVLKSGEEVLSRVRAGGADQVFIVLPIDRGALLREARELLGDEPVSTYFVPDLGSELILRSRVDEIDGVPIITLQGSPLYGWNALVKRAVDIALGGLALLLAAPVMALIALVLKLTSPGPVLFRQERMGLDGERFVMLKFRTMVENAEEESGPVWARRDDPRVTPIGRWLRRTSLDELPQLINVLRGEMSLVGPRPERPPLIERFRKEIPRYMLRLKVKGGLTGWAQVNGWRGDTSLEKRIEHDLYYIEHWSLGLDFKILALSLVRGFINRNAH